jgi:DNA-binding GntR family transcriptional regulator
MSRTTSPTNASERPEGLQDFASRRILRAIFSGELGPGRKLSPTKLAQEFEVSHIPVREALAGLAASGHVERVPRVGFFVAELSLDHIEDVYRWRRILEDEAHRIAVPNLDASDIARMRKINAMSARTAPYGERYIELRREFHFIPFQRVGSEILLDFLNRMWDASSRYMFLKSSLASPANVRLVREQQQRLMEAFESQDPELVNARMADHRETTLGIIRERVSALRKEEAAGA